MPQSQKSIVHNYQCRTTKCPFVQHRVWAYLTQAKVIEHHENNMLFDLLNTNGLAKKVLRNYAKTVDNRAKVFAF